MVNVVDTVGAHASQESLGPEQIKMAGHAYSIRLHPGPSSCCKSWCYRFTHVAFSRESSFTHRSCFTQRHWEVQHHPQGTTGQLIQGYESTAPLSQGGAALWCHLCSGAPVIHSKARLHSRPHPCSSPSPAHPASFTSLLEFSENTPSIHWMHPNTCIRLCFEGTQTKRVNSY